MEEEPDCRWCLTYGEGCVIFSSVYENLVLEAFPKFSWEDGGDRKCLFVFGTKRTILAELEVRSPVEDQIAREAELGSAADLLALVQGKPWERNSRQNQK